jgi:hypothetical protein
MAWKFIKFHSLDHLMAHITMFGWIENSSAQAGEHCHKFYLKVLKVLTNNHESWPRQIFKIHRREQGLRHLLGELRKKSPLEFIVVNGIDKINISVSIQYIYCISIYSFLVFSCTRVQTQAESGTLTTAGEQLEKEGPLRGEDGEESELFRNFMIDELDLPDAMILKKRGLESQTMGLRFPIWFTACRHRQFISKLVSVGSKKRGSDYIRLSSLSMPFSLAMQANKDLNKLASHLSKFLQENYHATCNIPVSIRPSESNLTHTLTWLRHTMCN